MPASVPAITKDGKGDYVVSVTIPAAEVVDPTAATAAQECLHVAHRALSLQMGVESQGADAVTRKAEIDAAVAKILSMPV